MILRRFMHRTKKDEGRAEEIDSHLTHEQDAHAARLICALEILAGRESACGAIGPSPGSKRDGETALRRAFSCPNTRVYIDRAPRFLASFLFGVKAWDPIAFIVTPALLSAVVALFAVWIPAKRATSVDPMTALRLE